MLLSSSNRMPQLGRGQGSDRLDLLSPNKQHLELGMYPRAMEVLCPLCHVLLCVLRYYAALTRFPNTFLILSQLLLL